MVPDPHDRWPQRFAAWVGRWVPDAITASVVLTLLVAFIALAARNPLSKVMEAYHQGLWMLLPFTMQMTLIIILSSALGASPFLRRVIAGLARIPKTRNQVIALAFVSAGTASYLSWGLGYALLPMVAIYFAAEAEKRDIAVDFPFLFAVTYAAQALWQYGLSSSAPLLIAGRGHFLQELIGVVPLSTTIWSPAALIHEAVYGACAIGAACLLMPKHHRPISHFPDSLALTKPNNPVATETGKLSFAQRLEQSRFVNFTVCGLMVFWLVDHFFLKHLGFELNMLTSSLLFMTFLLYGSVKLFARAVERSAASSWAVIVLYHLYAGVAGLIQFTSVGERMAKVAASVSTPWTFPLITALAGSVFACFIPSSGGQWTIQGYVTVKTAMAVGVSVQRGVLALGVGDHIGNFLTPFWYAVVAGIGKVDFRVFFGYGVIFAAIWFVVGVLVFTFAPC